MYDETVRSDDRAPPGLSMPEKLWCPECGVHARHQDVYGTYATEHILKPLCPVCQDKKDRKSRGLPE